MPQVALRKEAALSGSFVGAPIVLLALLLSAPPQAGAQIKAQPQNASPAPAAEQGIRWQELNSGQRMALKPLERDWSGISTNQKQKWLEIAARFPTLQPEEKGRIQGRMSEWVKLTAEQRSEARVNFQQAKQVAPRDRQAQWEAYQSLPPEERHRLAARATPASAPGAPSDASRRGERPEVGDKGGRDARQSKSNIVPNPAFAVPPKPVAPTVLQAQPGATTTLISKLAAPPPHQQTGLPKIAASPNFVDKATLLPQRGPQGAATRSAGASAAEAIQRR
jgi:Protein of unknown function (DUF3106)